MATFFNQATLSYNDSTVSSNVVSGEIREALTVTKTAVPETYSAGDTITYIISLVNAGSTDITGLTVTDDLGAYDFGAQQLVPLSYIEDSLLYFNDGVLQTAPTVTPGTSLEISGISVPADGNSALVYQVRANEYAPLAAGSQITNTATVSDGGIKVAVTASETINADEALEMSISKAISPSEITENGQVTYTFVIRNIGSSPATAADNAIVYDSFDPILTDITVTYNGAPTTEYSYDETTGEFATAAGLLTVPAAQFEQDSVTGVWAVTPGVSTLTVSGTISSVTSTSKRR